jgi:aminoglycoside phosphotransferase (APT) family kinase protein
MISSCETVFQQLSVYSPMPHEDRLVHDGFDPSNILVIQKDTKWAISEILDWEFAHEGSPMQDIASMLRNRERLLAEYAEGFLEGARQSLNIPDHGEITVNVCNAGVARLFKQNTPG